MTILIIQILLFAFYTIYVGKKYGIQKSISDSWYAMKESENWMFTVIFCYGIGISMVFQVVYSAWFFLSGAALVFVGAASDFKTWHVAKWVHTTGAVICIVAALLGLWEIGVQWVFYVIIAGLFVAIPGKNKIWWVEVTCFVAIMLGFLEYFNR
jgi:hypothetical protein